MTTAAVVLAAGGGTRYRGPTHKLLAPLDGRPVVAHAVAAAVDAGLDATYVVVGAVDLTGALPAGVTVVRNDGWAGGMATSIAAGIDAAAAGGHDAVVIGLGDAPGVAPESWRRVAASPAPVAVATYGSMRGHPVRLAAEVWPRLPRTGEVGARALFGRGDVEVAEVPCPGSAGDVDTVEDLAAWT